MQLILVLFALLCAFIYVTGFGEMIGPGRWFVQNIDQCEDSEQYKMRFGLARKKLNRTTDCFTITLKTDTEFNDDYGLELDVYKQVDGGYKYYQYFKDESACHFANQYAAKNLKQVLSLAGIDPPTCPIPPGDHVAEDYVFNYEELTDPFVYGTYEINLYLTFNGERVSCLKIYTKYEQNDDDDDDE